MRSFSKLKGHSRSNSIDVSAEHIKKLIKEKSWRRLLKVLDDPAVASCDLSRQGILHLLCRHDPPFDVVKRFIELYPDSPFEENCIEQTPLHIAASFSSHHVVVYLLSAINASSTWKSSWKDANGMTPLIYACKKNNEAIHVPFLFGGARQQHSLPIIRSLIEESPTTVNDEDIWEHTALEYAITSEATSDVIRTLHEACNKEHMRMKRVQKRRRGRRAANAVASVGFSPPQERNCRVPSVVHVESLNLFEKEVSAMSLTAAY